MMLKLVATCLFGLEKLLGEEIDALGYRRLDTIDGRVVFEAPERGVAVCNLRLRYAERVMILLSKFPARTFEELFQGTKAIPWEDWIGRNGAFPVKGHSVKSALFSVPDCQKIVKKAIADRLSSVYRISRLPETGTLYAVSFFLLRDEAYLMIDTTGITLHKRGYRTQAGIAPLRETLAAAMVRLSRPREDVLLVDPMCGSGTIAIEAALLTGNIAPGLYRSFSAETFELLPSSVWEEERERARGEIRPYPGKIYASDLDESCIQLAKENARRAGVADRIEFCVADVRRFSSPEPGARGTIVTNPPYGERLGDLEEARALAAAMGKAFRENIPAWQLYIITSDEQFERFFGRRADKVRKLYNGMIRCGFYQFFRRT
ncbi:MAG: class I SAM-dependent RNA methyltransferase [Oscillospiraceae bacterium]|nr:class I SAM-dependent RNA methyltransferase [Oscillospiraceae bacterium]